MRVREQIKVASLQWGIVIFTILPIVGWYLYVVDIPTSKDDMYGFTEIALTCFSGMIIILGIAGVISFLIRLLISPERPSAYRFLLLITIVFGIWVVVIASILINPLGTSHLRFQTKMGKHDFRYINMEQADLSSIDLARADLTGANFKNANLKNASFVRANLNSTILDGADLRGAGFGGAEMIGIDLSDREFEDGWFPNTNLSKANLQRADFSGANFNVAILIGAELTGTDLSTTNFAYADLTGANLSGAKLTGANLVGADLSYAVISDEQLFTATRLSGATMPNGKTYNGRFNFAADLEAFNFIHRDDPGPAEYAKWYNVSEEDYLAGQEWAEENLPDYQEDRDE